MSETTTLARVETVRSNGSVLPAVRVDTTSIDLMTLCDALARSGYFKDARDASQAVVKVLLGQELGGIGPVSAMSAIHIVEGKPAPSATLLAALVKRSGRYDYRVLRRDNEGCELLWFERGAEVGRSSFTHEDAVRAKLESKDNYRKYPRSMHFARALTDGVRTFAPDLLGGMPVYTPEELGAEVNPETGEVIESRRGAGIVSPETGELLPFPTPRPAERLTDRVTGATEKAPTYSAATVERTETDLKALQNLLIEVFLAECQGGAARADLDMTAIRDYVARTLGLRDPVLGKLSADQLQTAIAATRALPKLRARGMALYAEAGGSTQDGAAMRGDMARVLGRPVETRKTIAADEWRRWIKHLEEQAGTPPAAEAPEGDPFAEDDPGAV